MHNEVVAVKNFEQYGEYKGLAIMCRIDDHPTEWVVSVKAGRFSGDLFSEVLPVITRRVPRSDGALNCSMPLVDEIKIRIDELPADNRSR